MKTERRPIRTVIVEDLAAEQEHLRKLLSAEGDRLHVEAVATDIPEAKELLEKTRPDLVFMDVMLPSGNCFDLLDSLRSIPFHIIFTTSHEAYAVKAFRLSAIDYLLKPVDPSELKAALQKFYERRDAAHADQLRNLLANIHLPSTQHKRVALPTLKGFQFVSVHDIIRCEADDTYTIFHTTDKGKTTVCRTLRDCEALLQDFGFARIHNSHLINMEHVAEYRKGDGGEVRMRDGSVVEVSRRRKDEFLRQLRQA